MNTNSSDEIDLIDLLKKVFKAKKTILYITIISSAIGVLLAVITPNKYTAKTVFIPQNQDSGSTSLSGVASLVGINLGNNTVSGYIPSAMYPQIAQSSKFKRLLLSENIDIIDNVTLKSYLIKTHGLSFEDANSSSNLYVSKLEEKCFELITKIISISVNQKDGFVSISASMSNAEYSATVASKAKEILQKIIIENKIESAKQNLIFTETQLSEKRVVFDEVQAKLAFFSDSNLNSVNSFVINEKSKLEAEFEIINAVVTELSKQVEQAKLQVTKDTPVFSTIIEAVIPNERTSPKRIELILIFGFIGFILGILYALTIDPVREIIHSFKD